MDTIEIISLYRFSATRNGAEWRRTVARIAADKTFVVLGVATLLIAIVFMQSMSTLPIYLRESGFSHLQFGMLMSVNGILIFLLQLPLTHWLSRYNPMKVVTVGGVLIAVGFGLYAYPPSTWFLTLAVIVWTLGEILQAPFKHAIITDLAPPAMRATYLGLFGVSYSLAVMIGAPLGGLALRSLGPESLWIGCSVIAMLAVALYLVIARAVDARLAVARACETSDAPMSDSPLPGHVQGDGFEPASA